MSRDEVAHALGERVKELTALHAAATLLEHDDLLIAESLARLADLLPPAFQYPEITAGRVQYGNLTVTTATYRDSPWTITTRLTTSDDVPVRIDVVYLAERPPSVEGPFLAEERRLIDSLGRMLQSALDRRLAEAARRRADEELRAALIVTAAERDRSRMLLEITGAIASTLDLRELLARISRLLASHVPHHYASVTLWDAEARTLRRHALVFDSGGGLLQDGVLLTTSAPTPARVAFDRGETMVYRSAEIADLGPHSQQVMAAEGLKSACCVPLKTARGTIGTINVAADREDAFAPREVELLQQFANQVAFAIDNALAYGQISELKDRLNDEKLYLEDEVTGHQEFRDIIGRSHLLTEVLKQIRTVAPTDATVLLLGETGTGKEVLARAVHEASRRCTETFVRVNGAALPANLVESELFGYERGAFTGAVGSKAGRFELAHKGTLFLDEIGEVPIEVQPKLLRALQEQEFERLGGTRTVHVDVRVIAATNRRLEDMVGAGTFRQDLYYRLNVFPIVVPPLRERPEDIPALVTHFAQKFGRELGREIRTIPASTLRALQNWNWPGNIRELQNVVERAVILAQGGELRIAANAFKDQESSRAIRLKPEVRLKPDPTEVLTPFQGAERDRILNALREAEGVIGGPGGAAARLGLKRTTLHSKMQKLGIVRRSF